MRRKAITAFVSTAVLLAVTACGGNTSTAPPQSSPGKVDQVKVGVIAIVDVAPIYLGKQKGFFSKRNIDVSMETSQGGAAIVPGVVSGQFQFGFSNVTSLLLAKSNNIPIKMVNNGVASSGTPGDDFSGVVVKGDSPIKTAADLAGKSVSVNTLKNIGDTTVRASVRKAGGDPKTVKFVELPLPNMGAALQAGQVDAIWVVEPFLTAAKDQGGRVVAWNFAEAVPNLTVATYFTSQQMISGNADLVKRFKEAIAESLAYASSHADEVRAIIPTYTTIKADVAGKLTLPKWPADINTASLQAMEDLAIGDGLLTQEKAPKIADLLP
jgi:NitT/TauT family transport system substrate-binding protein